VKKLNQLDFQPFEKLIWFFENYFSRNEHDCLADLGEDIKTPQKKPKGGELSEAEKAKNRELSAKRVIVRAGSQKSQRI